MCEPGVCLSRFCVCYPFRETVLMRKINRTFFQSSDIKGVRLRMRIDAIENWYHFSSTFWSMVENCIEKGSLSEVKYLMEKLWCFLKSSHHSLLQYMSLDHIYTVKSCWLMYLVIRREEIQIIFFFACWWKLFVFNEICHRVTPGSSETPSPRNNNRKLIWFS